ncbi:TetR/AcrR family transcriptional regulator [Vibrio panuliri]|uniref:TetR family transcriptional regulator n=1 Tax=Vibrio panuliri TaxID=1381081 RepID=A0A1Q9HAD1_9VIBR|nr:TetR/AcrR family transcriptional regulator [Vibrio panuliri]KAB1457480.1 TetR/AcrR family transcriptional regulator [Vibrio panuliri]OLQ85926.1 TetR family transcriptional regulator [Vibrio panuliri]OLQ88590.1 TetR family transcriptional regulator [Vibrio panuliri]
MIERKQGRRSAQDAVKTKADILRVAANMFCELGYERVSLRQISERAGVSHSLIRHHFGSKEKIWYAISDCLQEFMIGYIHTIIENMPHKLPANEKMYIFAVRLLAHMLVSKQPIQLIADAVRQEDALLDYFVDKSGKIQAVVDAIADEYNQEHPQTPINVWEIKWQMIMYAHGAASLTPFMLQTWSEETDDIEQCLLNHWQMFNKIMAHRLQVDPDKVLNPKSISELVYAKECAL